MRFELAFFALAVAGCASAGSSATGDDAGHGSGSSHVDAPTAKDDAPSHPIDAPMHIDAPPDSPTVVPPDACVPITKNILVNGGFELDSDHNQSGAGAWIQDPAYGDPSLDPILIPGNGLTPQTPKYIADLGDIEADFDDTAIDDTYQDVPIPANTTSLAISGYWFVRTDETTSSSKYDHGELELGKTDNSLISIILDKYNTDHVTTWQNFAFAVANASSYSGQTLRIYMTSANDDSNATGFYFDSLTMTATYGCP